MSVCVCEGWWGVGVWRMSVYTKESVHEQILPGEESHTLTLSMSSFSWAKRVTEPNTSLKSFR